MIVDNRSPFTPNIEERLTGAGIENRRVDILAVSVSDLDNYSSVILSGRRKNSREINSANSKITKHCSRIGIPVLGICYGAEIIALTFGGTIRKMAAPVQGNSRVIVSKPNQLTKNEQSIDVYESHAFCIGQLPPGFLSLASSDDCQHEIFSHKQLPIFGTQFHPEKSGRDGGELLRNFVALKQERFYLHRKEL